jgi:hypothetical protein
VLGSLVPLCMFLSWEAVALNLIPTALTGVPAEALPDPSIIMEAAFHPPAAVAGAGAAMAAVLPAAAGSAGVAMAASVPAVAELAATSAAPVAAAVAAAPLADVVVPVEELGRIAVDPLQVRTAFLFPASLAPSRQGCWPVRHLGLLVALFLPQSVLGWIAAAGSEPE